MTFISETSVRGSVSAYAPRNTSTITKKIAAIVEHFKNLLSPEEYAKFAEMQNLQEEIDLIEDAELFEYAFCAGSRLMIDVFKYKGT